MRAICTTALFGLFLYPYASAAQTSQDYARMGSAAWSAFECSTLASKSGDKKEQERLFLFGYDQGKKFIAAVNGGKVKREDLSNGTPWIMLALLEGPSPDFMLGRMFGEAQESALEDVYKTGTVHHKEEMQKTKAKDKFWKQNCHLLGK